MDLAIITTKNRLQKQFWENRLRITFPQTKFIVVVEDWHGGAGNGLGTLYAFLQANSFFQKIYHQNLLQWLENGHSLTLYHCAGEGQRLYPLSASEHNNKSALKLPGLIPFGATEDPITLLEAILKQTDPMSKDNPGRLSVFWGDQLFLPSKTTSIHSRHPLEIYVKEIPFPNSKGWKRENLENYGIVCFDGSGTPHILEKCTWDQIDAFIKDNCIVPERGVNISFGSFSITAPLLQALLKEFSQELECKTGKFDSDPHFWMPLTLPLKLYQTMMGKKKMNSIDAEKHYKRLEKVKNGFQDILGIINMGRDCSFWDFGNVVAYKDNLLRILEDTEESDTMRKFLQMPQDGILKSKIGKSKIVRSIIVGTNALELEAEDSVIIGSLLNKLSCKNSLYYNVHEEAILEQQEDVVRADVNGEPFYSTLQSDPKLQWSQRLHSNPLSWEELHLKIEGTRG